MLHQLLEARRLGLAVPATLLVKAFQDAHGFKPKVAIARELDVSVRTVERALAELKALGISSSGSSATSVSQQHDHALKANLEHQQEHDTEHEHGRPRARATDVSGGGLEEQLLAFGVLPWCVKVVLEKVEPVAIAQQLEFHAHRLASGFEAKTEGGAAKVLFRACLGAWPAPKGFYEGRARTVGAGDTIVQSVKQNDDFANQAVIEHLPPRNAVPDAEPAPEMTRDGALSVVRIGIRSRIPALREQALAVATRFDIDVSTLTG